MKRIVITRFGMLVAMLLTILPISAYDFEVDGIYYDVVSVSDLTCKVVSSGEKYKGHIEIPSEVTYNLKKLKVIEIGADAFENCYDLTAVVIPNSVTVIGDSAFRWSSLTSIIIPDSVTEIGMNAFRGCQLTSVIIPETVTVLGDWAFEDCFWLTSVIFSYSGRCNGIFYNCNSLSSVIITDSVTEINYGLFSDCKALSSVIIADSVTKIGASAFSGCSSLTSLIIPDSVTEIGASAFSGCSSLEEIKLSNSLETLQYATFYGCKSLKSLTIPGSVTKLIQSVGDNYDYLLFGGCKALTEIKFEYGLNDITGYFTDNYNYNELYDTEISFSMSKLDILQLEKVFIDRIFGNSLELPYLKELTLGEHISEVQVVPSSSGVLETITCYATVPPICPEFTNDQYLNVTVKVPQQSLEAYQNTEGWKNFWNLQGFDAATVDNVNSDSHITVTGRYDLNGKAITDGYEGIAIICYSDGSTRKIVVRR